MPDLRVRAGRQLLGMCLLLLAIAACSDAEGPLPPNRTVIIVSGETPELTVVNGTSGRIARRVALDDGVETAAISSDRSTLYLAEGSVSPGDLVALDTRAFQVKWREKQSTTIDPRAGRWDGVGVAGSYALAPSADDSVLYLAPAFRSDTLGVAKIDASSRDLVAVEIGLVPGIRGLDIIPESSAVAAGTLVLGGMRHPYAFPAVEWLYLLDPVTLAVQDSSGVIDVGRDGRRYIISPRCAPDGRYVYLIALGATGGLVQVDLATGKVVANAPIGSGDWFAISPDGARIYQTRRSIGPGLPATLFIYDSWLRLVGSVDLPSQKGHPPVVQDVAASPDGARVYIIAGTGSRVLLRDPVQSGELIAVDPIARKVLWTTALNVWLPRQVFVR